MKPILFVLFICIIFKVAIPWKENAPERSAQKAEQARVKNLERNLNKIQYAQKFPANVVITANAGEWSEWVSLVSPRGYTDRFWTRTNSNSGYEIQYRSLSGMVLNSEIREPDGNYWPPDDVGALRIKPLDGSASIQLEAMFPNR